MTTRKAQEMNDYTHVGHVTLCDMYLENVTRSQTKLQLEDRFLPRPRQWKYIPIVKRSAPSSTVSRSWNGTVASTYSSISRASIAAIGDASNRHHSPHMMLPARTCMAPASSSGSTGIYAPYY